MASIKDLKKDIDSLIFEIISDCFTFGGLHPDDKADKLSDIVSDAVSLRNELIKRANSPKRSDDHKVVRTHFQLVEKDLFTGVDKLCNRLSALSAKKE